jgi:hypothetical protein
MEDASRDVVSRVLGELLRAPEPLRDLEVERALTRLSAARSDTPYLLLHRVLVLESALLQLRERATTGGVPAVAAASAPGALPPVAPAAPARSFLRDAAVVTLGVVAGQAVWDGMTADSAGSAGESGLLDGLLD